MVWSNGLGDSDRGDSGEGKCLSLLSHLSIPSIIAVRPFDFSHSCECYIDIRAGWRKVVNFLQDWQEDVSTRCEYGLRIEQRHAHGTDT